MITHAHTHKVAQTDNVLFRDVMQKIKKTSTSGWEAAMQTLWIAGSVLGKLSPYGSNTLSNYLIEYSWSDVG